jgi:hypothetical protein
MFKPINPFPLKQILLVDAAICTGSGALLAAASAWAGQLMQIPPALLFYVGLSLLPIGAFMAVVATRDPVHPAGTRMIIIGNLLWVGASFLLLVSGWIAPNSLGSAFIVLQALMVAVLAWLEHTALSAALFRTA